MQKLINSSFQNNPSSIELIMNGKYDIVGPTGDIILPQVWEAVVKPGWIVELRLHSQSIAVAEMSGQCSDIPAALIPNDTISISHEQSSGDSDGRLSGTSLRNSI